MTEFLVTVIRKGEKKTRTIEADNALSARLKVYHKLMDAGIKSFYISDVVQKIGRR